MPLADRVAAELQRLWEDTPYQANDDPVFAHPRGTGLPLDASAVSKRFQLALRRAAVRRVRFHDLRHTFGTMMARDPRVSMRTLQGWLGRGAWVAAGLVVLAVILWHVVPYLRRRPADAPPA